MSMPPPQQEDFDWMNAFTDQHYWPDMAQHDADVRDMPSYHDQQENFALPEPSGTYSCQAAADTIRMIKPEIGPELETELGCWVGEECQVPNEKVFGIMGRYTDPNL